MNFRVENIEYEIAFKHGWVKISAGTDAPLKFFSYHEILFDQYRRATVCILRRVQGSVLEEGRAVCSNKDNFSRETGRQLALCQVVSKLESRQPRTAWTRQQIDRILSAYTNRKRGK